MGEIQLLRLLAREIECSKRPNPSRESYHSDRCTDADEAGIVHGTLSVFLIGCPERQVHGNSPIIIQDGQSISRKEI